MLVDVQEYDQWIQQSSGILRSAVLFITNRPQENIERTEHIYMAIILIVEVILHFATSCFTLPLETMCKPFQPVFNPNDGCHVSFEFIFTIKSAVEWCFHDGCETLSRQHWASQHQTEVSLQLTPVPTYTSVSVLSHL